MAGRRSIVRILSLAMATGVLLGACAGSSGAPSTPAVSAAGSATPAASPVPSASSAAATPSSPAPDASGAVIDLGAVGVTPRGSRVTVHSFAPSERSVEPPAGSAWQEADLEWCLPSTLSNPVTIGNIRYEVNLELSDGTTIEPEAEAHSPDEIYASDGQFSANECVQGALVFAVPTGSTPEYLLLVGGKGGMRWRLS